MGGRNSFGSLKPALVLLSMIKNKIVIKLFRNQYIFSYLIINLLASTTFCHKLLSKLYFSDISSNKFGKFYITNQVKLIRKQWQFDWLEISMSIFKIILKEPFNELN